MFKDISLIDNDGGTKFTFSEWSEVGGLLEISMAEWEDSSYVNVCTLSVLTKEMWEEFKQAGDIAFNMMEK